MEFNVWDIGGPASMATVNQCFFTDKALYVVVWNLALGEEAVASLQFWLLSIEVRARGPRPVTLAREPEGRCGRNALRFDGFRGGPDPWPVAHSGRLDTSSARCRPHSSALSAKSSPVGNQRGTGLRSRV